MAAEDPWTVDDWAAEYPGDNLTDREWTLQFGEDENDLKFMHLWVKEESSLKYRMRVDAMQKSRFNKDEFYYHYFGVDDNKEPYPACVLPSLFRPDEIQGFQRKYFTPSKDYLTNAAKNMDYSKVI